MRNGRWKKICSASMWEPIYSAAAQYEPMIPKMFDERIKLMIGKGWVLIHCFTDPLQGNTGMTSAGSNALETNHAP